ncbi:MAG: Gfo/Idh/MocA family oxidoreductase, partial [Planctomycetota bacterium]
MSDLKGVAVGAGYFSQFHFDAWSRLDGVDFAAICDLDRATAEAAARQYGVKSCYTNFEEMLDHEKPDFVDIITRPDSHIELTRIAAERDIAVICQKPLTPSFDSSRGIVELAKTSGIRFMVHENFRFQPWYREIKRLLDSGVIGEKLHSISVRSRMGDGWQDDAYLARQPYFRTMPRFLIFETGVHFVDTFRFLGGEITGVYASLRRLNTAIAGEDAGVVLFEFESGAEATWDANRYNESSAKNPRYTFGEALVESDGGSIRLFQDGRMTIQPLGEAERAHDYDHGHRNFASDCVFSTQSHFVHCLRNGDPFETSGEE